MDVFCIDSVNIDSIEGIRDPWSCINSIDIYSIDGMVEKPSVSSFQNFLWIENQLNIKKVMGQECVGCVLRVVSTVSTNIAFNALRALIFVSTVSTNKIPYSIHNSIALIFCIDCLNIPFNVHSSYNVDSNIKTSNYMKIQFKSLDLLLITRNFKIILQIRDTLN